MLEGTWGAGMLFLAWAELISPRKNVSDTTCLLRIHDALPGCS